MTADMNKALDALIKDAELVIKIMSETGTFETGQGIIRSMINMLTAQDKKLSKANTKIMNLRNHIRGACKKGHSNNRAMRTMQKTISRLQKQIEELKKE